MVAELPRQGLQQPRLGRAWKREVRLLLAAAAAEALLLAGSGSGPGTVALLSWSGLRGPSEECQGRARCSASGSPLQPLSLRSSGVAASKGFPSRRQAVWLRAVPQPGLAAALLEEDVAEVEDRDGSTSSGGSSSSTSGARTPADWAADQPHVRRIKALSDAADIDGTLELFLDMRRRAEAENWPNPPVYEDGQRGLKSKVLYSFVLRAARKAGDVGKTLEVIELCQRDGVPIYDRTLSKLFTSPEISDDMISAMQESALNGFQYNGATYNSVMNAFSQAEPADPDAVERVVEMMEASGVSADQATHTFRVVAHARAGWPDEAAEILRRSETMGFEVGALAYRSLVQAFCASNRMEDAEDWQGIAKERGLRPDRKSCASMAEAYAKAGKLKEAELWMDRALKAGGAKWAGAVPATTFRALLRACARAKEADSAEKWAKAMEAAGHSLGRAVYADAAAACAANDREDEAIEWLGKMRDAGMEPGASAFTTIMDACARNGKPDAAFSWLSRMLDSGVQPTVQSFTAAISACARVGRVDEASQIFDKMAAFDLQPDIVAWNSVITACAREGRANEAGMWIGEMEACGVEPDVFTYIAAINSCANAGLPDQAINWFGKMEDAGIKPNTRAYACVINAYSSAGRYEEAIECLDFMDEEGLKADEVCYKAIIGACAKAGRPVQAATFLRQMEATGLQSDAFAYDKVISACCADPPRPGLMEKLLWRMLQRGVELNDRNKKRIGYTVATLRRKVRHPFLFEDVYEALGLRGAERKENIGPRAYKGRVPKDPYKPAPEKRTRNGNEFTDDDAQEKRREMQARKRARLLGEEPEAPIIEEAP